MTHDAGPTVYGIIGVGAIAAAIVRGLCNSPDEAPPVLLSPRNAALAAGLATQFPSVTVAADNQAVVDGASVIVLSVRPQDAASILSELRFRQQQAVVSVMAGVPLDALRSMVAPVENVSRAVPLPAVARREGATPIYPAAPAAESLFGRLGTAIGLADEDAFEAISASSGTVAAHFAYLGEITRWLVGKNVAEEAARRHVAATFAGLSDDLRGEAPDFEHLAREHATKGGINEQFRRSLEEAGLSTAVGTGLDGVFARLVRRSAE